MHLGVDFIYYYIDDVAFGSSCIVYKCLNTVHAVGPIKLLEPVSQREISFSEFVIIDTQNLFTVWLSAVGEIFATAALRQTDTEVAGFLCTVSFNSILSILWLDD